MNVVYQTQSNAPKDNTIEYLMMCVKTSDLSRLQALIKSKKVVNLGVRDKYGNNAMFYAAVWANYQIFEMLHSAGACMYSDTIHGVTGRDILKKTTEGQALLKKLGVPAKHEPSYYHDVYYE